MTNFEPIGLGGAVLLADDHEMLRIGLADTLRKRLNATRVIEASCYREALENIDQSDLKLAIFDLGMPDFSDPCHQLLHIRHLRPSMKVVVYTGSEDRSHILDVLRAGIHGYILKKDNVDNLIERLQYVLSGEVYVPPLLSQPPSLSEMKTGLQKLGGVASGQLPDVKLSTRQFEVLTCLVDGCSNKEIARNLKLAESTVKMHVGAVFRALGVNNRAKAAAVGQRILDQKLT